MTELKRIPELNENERIDYNYILNRISGILSSNSSISNKTNRAYIDSNNKNIKNKIISFLLNYGFKHKDKIKKNLYLQRIARKVKVYLYSIKDSPKKNG